MNRFFRDGAVGAICFILSVSNAVAQSGCGCGASAMSMGILQIAPKHAVGLRGQSQSFRTAGHHSEVGAHDLFQTAEVWGRAQIGRRWQVLAALPFVFSEKRSDDGQVQRVNGLSDATAMGHFLVIDGKKQSSCSWQKRLQIGLGAKFPTGSFGKKSSDGERLPDNFQPGTGTTDALATAFFVLSRREKGIQLDANARLGGKNSVDFRPGARVLTGAQAFSMLRFRKIKALARAGASFDARAQDQKNGTRERQSGGWGLFSTLGADVFASDFVVGLNWQMPFAHDFGGGHVAPKSRFQASATWLFGGKKSKKMPSLPLFPTIENAPKNDENHP